MRIQFGPCNFRTVMCLRFQFIFKHLVDTIYYRVEHPHTRRHSHRPGQQGSHVQPYHSRRRRKDHIPLDHPFNINPKWKLRAGQSAGPWLVGSIICDQYVDQRHIWRRAPPKPRQYSRLGRVPDKKAKIEQYFDKRHYDDWGTTTWVAMAIY